jgi:hypothetical protein
MVASPLYGSYAIRPIAVTGHPAPDTADGISFAGAGEPLLDATGNTLFLGNLIGPGVFSHNNSALWYGNLDNVVLVAREGDPVPGTDQGTIFSDLGLSNVGSEGQVIFGATTQGPDGERQGLWSGVAGDIAPLIRNGDQAPGTPPEVVFDSFGESLIRGGLSAFEARISGPSVSDRNNNNNGIWVERDGSLNLVARRGDPAPDTDLEVDFKDLQGFMLSASGAIALNGRLDGPGIDSSNESGIWSDRTGGLELVARKGNQAPGTQLGVSFGYLQLRFINSQDAIAFSAELTGPGVDETNITGIWSDRSGSLELLVRDGELVPNAALPGTVFRGYGNQSVAMNRAGQIAFESSLAPGGNGIFFSDHDGDLRSVAVFGDPATDTPQGVSFQFVFGPQLNAHGDIAFLAELIGNGVDATNDRGLWVSKEGSLELVVREGDEIETAPGVRKTVDLLTPALGQSTDGGRFLSSLNDAGQIAFWARLTDGTTGAFIAQPPVAGDFNGDGRLGVGDISLLANEILAQTHADEFDITDDGLVDHTDLNDWVHALKRTWLGDANLDGEFDSGDLVAVFEAGKYEQDVAASWLEGDWNADGRFGTGDLVVAFEDGGYVTAAVPAIPEPTSAVMLFAGLIVLATVSNSRRKCV